MHLRWKTVGIPLNSITSSNFHWSGYSVLNSKLRRWDRLCPEEQSESGGSDRWDAAGAGTAWRRGCLHQHQVHGADLRVLLFKLNYASWSCPFTYNIISIYWILQNITALNRYLLPKCYVCLNRYMLEIIVVYIYYIIDFDQHPGGDASRVWGTSAGSERGPTLGHHLVGAYSFFFTLWGE